MTRINRTDRFYLNVFLNFSARNLPVINAKNKLNISFQELKISFLNLLYYFYQYRLKENIPKLLKIVFIYFVLLFILLLLEMTVA